MRPIYHPKVKDITLEGILHALSDPIRVYILRDLVKDSCAKMCTSFIKVNNRTLAKSSLSQHIKILREAGLIRTEKVGVEMRNTPRCAEIQSRFGDLVEHILKTYEKIEGYNKKKKK